MLNIETGIRSLSEFKQNSSEILTRIKQTHQPTVLTVNGRAEAVLLDPKTYQEMSEKLYLVDSARRIEQRLVDSMNSKGVEIDDFFDKMIKKYTKDKPKNDKKV